MNLSTFIKICMLTLVDKKILHLAAWVYQTNIITSPALLKIDFIQMNPFISFVCEEGTHQRHKENIPYMYIFPLQGFAHFLYQDFN